MLLDVSQRSKVAFAEYLSQEQSRLYGYIHSLVRDLNDADDLFQQTTLILWKKFAEFDRRLSFFAWACGVARLEVANFLRGRSRQRLYFSDDLNLLLAETQAALASDEAEARREALARCLELLRQRDRELLDQCYAAATGVHEAADRHGRSTHSIYNSLRRIRRALYECVGRRLAREWQSG